MNFQFLHVPCSSVSGLVLLHGCGGHTESPGPADNKAGCDYVGSQQVVRESCAQDQFRHQNKAQQHTGAALLHQLTINGQMRRLGSPQRHWVDWLETTSDLCHT